MFAKPGNERRTFAGPRRHFLVGDNHRGATGHGHDDFQDMQRVGDHFAGQHLFDGQRLAIEHRLRVGQGVGALVDGYLGHRPLVVVVLCGITLGNHRVAGVLAHVPVRQVELGLGRAKGRAVPTETHGPSHPAGVLVGTQRRHARGDDAQDRLA
ncbi:hypothetical protein D3C87_1270430 [compost metagenome]